MPTPQAMRDVPPATRKAQVPRRAVQVVQRHMAAGQLLKGEPTDQCRSLFLLGGCLCKGPRERLYFAAREDMVLQLPHLASHRQEMWLK